MADENEVLLRVRTEGTEQAASELKEVSADMKGVGTASEEAAEQTKAIQDGLAHVSTEIEKIRKSNTTFDEQKAKLEGMRAPLEANLAEMKKLGSEGKQVADGLATALGRVDAALAEIARQSSTAVRAIEAARTAEQKLDEAIETGSPRANTALIRLLNTTENLRRAIEERGRSGEQVAESEIAELSRLEAKLKEATDVIRIQKDRQQEYNDTLREGGERWAGLGDAINKALGPMGKMQAQAALTFAAFAEGYRIGQQLNTFFGTDMSEWNQATATFGLRANLVIRSIADNVVALGNIMVAISDGSVSEFKRALTEMTEVMGFGSHSSLALSHALQDTDEQVRAYAISQGISTKATEDAIKANQEAAEAVKKTKDAGAAATAQTSAGTAAAQAATTATIGYRDEQGRLHMETVNVSEASKSQAANTAAAGTAIAGAKTEVVGFRDEQGRLRIETREVANAMGQQATAAHATTDAMLDMFKNGVPGINQTKAAVDALEQSFIRAAAAARQAEAAIHAASQAGMGTTTRSGTTYEQG